MCDKRLWFIFGIMVVLTGVLSWRLFCLQIIEGSAWKAQAQGQQRLFEQSQGERGNIYLSNINGSPVPVAVNKNIYHAYISPREITEKEKNEVIEFSTEFLSIEEDFITERIKKNTGYEVLKRNLAPEDVEKVNSAPNVHLYRERVREYPEENLAAHVLGFVGGKNTGQYGVEQYYENIIGGQIGIKEGVKNPWGMFIATDSTKRGEDIVLTIDYNIQHFSERALENTVKRTGSSGGTVIVGDPNSGEILALTNYPSFNLNNYSQEDVGVFKNPALQETFEPGSVFKPITMVAALDRGVINPEDTFYDSGEARIHGRVIRNYNRRSYGLVTATEIMEKSINTGIVHVKDQMGNDVFLDYLQKFGFFNSTGIDLHGEVYSQNRSFLEGHDVNFATASYGQGIEVTAVQLFRAFSVLANGGVKINPHITKNNADNFHFSSEERLVSPAAASLVTEMMVSTVEQGFGSTAKVPGYYIAGKTGTAQVAWSKLGIPRSGYSDRTIQGFIGYAPAFNPSFVILIKLDQPQTRSAEVSAAPLFKEIAEYIFKYKKIPHDYEI